MRGVASDVVDSACDNWGRLVTCGRKKYVILCHVHEEYFINGNCNLYKLRVA